MTTRTRRSLGLFLCAATLPILALALPRFNRHAEIAKPGKPRIVLLPQDSSSLWTSLRSGVESAAREAPGVAVEIKERASGEDGPEWIAQERTVDDLLAAGVEAIALTPADAPSQTAMLDRAAQKALLFTFRVDAPQSRRACFVGTDHVQAGRQAGAEIKRALPRGGGVVVFNGLVDSAIERDQIAGMQQALKGSKVRLLGVPMGESEAPKHQAEVARVLGRPGIAGVVLLQSNRSGTEILSEVEKVRPAGKVKVIAFGREPHVTEGLKTGTISATIVEQPALQAATAVRVMAQVLAGNRAAIPASKKIFIPSLSIRPSNVRADIEKLKKLERLRPGDLNLN